MAADPAGPGGRDDEPGEDGRRDEEPAIEPKLQGAFSRIVEEGEHRLHRTWSDMCATGTVAGIEVGVGILVLLVVEQRTGSRLLGGLAFSIGFLALLLGHSELFTEGFLVPVTVTAAGRAPVRKLVAFWVATLVTNLLGGWIVSWLFVPAFPGLAATARHAAAGFLDPGIGVRSLALGLLAGAVITLMTRLQHGTDSVPAKIAAAVASAFVLAGLPLFHSILDSIVIFVALHAGNTRFGYLDWLGWLGWAVLWNMVGGLGLITLLRLVRSREAIRQELHRAQ